MVGTILFTLALQLSMPVPPTLVPMGALVMKYCLALNATVHRAGADLPVRSVSVWGLHKVGTGQHLGVWMEWLGPLHSGP